MSFDILRIKENVSLAGFTTWKIGGGARFFVEANSYEIPEIFSWAQSQGFNTYILGAGSNVLIKDSGVDGLVIRVKDDLKAIEILDDVVSVGAGVRLAQFTNYIAKNGIAGFEFLAGIPASVGGAVFMNAGVAGENKREIADVFQGATLYNFEKGIFDVGIDFMEFAHRYSSLQNSKNILLSAKFKIEKKSVPDVILKNIREIVKARFLREPENKRNAGSVFKACEGVAAGALIDRAGLKGTKIGGAMVSFKHANWIENLGDATSNDVEALVAFIKANVFEKFGMRLEEEIKIFGD